MATFKSLQLLRNTTPFASKAEALVKLTGDTASISDGSIKLARYYADGKIATVFGIYEEIGDVSGYTVYDSADDVSAALEDRIKELSASTVGENGKYIKTITQENGVVTAVAESLDTNAVTRETSSTDTILTSATTVEEALQALQDAFATERLKSGDGINVSDEFDTIDLNADKQSVKITTTAGKTFANGDTISANTVYAADAIIEETFKVLGGNVGQLTSGTEIKGGTTVIELLKQMLVKEADCTAVKPTNSVTINYATTPVEVGTVLTETMTASYTDGKFTGSTADYGTEYSVNAGCDKDKITYYRNDTALATTTDTSYTDSAYTMEEGTTSWGVVTSYGASTVTPQKNNGTNSTVSISAGSTAKATASVTAKYKYYIGSTTEADPTAMTVDKITATSIAKSGWITVDGTTTLVNASGKYTLPEDYFVVMVPEKYKLATIQDYTSGSSYLDNFTTGTVEVAIGGTSKTNYTVYLWVKSKATPDSKNITITKA